MFTCKVKAADISAISSLSYRSTFVLKKQKKTKKKQKKNKFVHECFTTENIFEGSVTIQFEKEEKWNHHCH